jgi:hypothetical protein
VFDDLANQQGFFASDEVSHSGVGSYRKKTRFCVNFTHSEKLQVERMTEISIVDDFQQVS